MITPDSSKGTLIVAPYATLNQSQRLKIFTLSKSKSVIIAIDVLLSGVNYKDEIFSCHERGTKKNSRSPTGIEPMAS